MTRQLLATECDAHAQLPCTTESSRANVIVDDDINGARHGDADLISCRQ